MIQGITMPDHRYEQYLKEVDYIRTRVFPGSCVPSASAMIEAVKDSDLRPASLFDFDITMPAPCGNGACDFWKMKIKLPNWATTLHSGDPGFITFATAKRVLKKATLETFI